MTLMVDRLSTRYGLLPSECIERATTYDIQVMDIAIATEVYEHKKAMNKGREPPPELDQHELSAALARAKDIAK